MDTFKSILNFKIVAILRGFEQEVCLRITESLIKGGVKLVEITLNSKNAFESIRKLNKEFSSLITIGAGTVIDTQGLQKAADAGATFIISPHFDPEIIKLTKKIGLVSLPGGFSPTEIYNAYKAGGDIIKVFPSNLGPSYIKNVKGPFNQIPLMPTGGVNPENIQEYLKAGAVAFGVGGELLKSARTGKDFYKDIQRNAEEFTASLSSAGLM